MGALAVAALALALPWSAAAQGKARAEEPVKRGASKVVRPEELKVEGKVDRPKAAPITPPPVAIPGERDSARSHVPKILDALDGGLF